VDLEIPELALVLLIGPSGSGKSTFAHTHFLNTEVVSSDTCRGLVSDDCNDQTSTSAAFRVLYAIVSERLAAGRLTVIDATNVNPVDRKALVTLAREYHCLPCAILFELPENICHARNQERPDRTFGRAVIRRQISQLRRGAKGLKREGFRNIHRLQSVEDIDDVQIQRVPLWNNRSEDHGPFDIIGDVHGCLTELTDLLAKLGYSVTTETIMHPENRRPLFVGDLIDRGPDSVGVLRLVMAACKAKTALCVPGNHDVKLLRKLRGKSVGLTHGLAETWAQLEKEDESFRQEVADFIYSLVSHYVLDGGNLVVAHAGLPEEMHGRGSGAVREFALYGDTTGETDEFGLPVRLDWALDYSGRATVVFGHTPVPEADWVNGTIDIDTGCCFGGKLTALRWPEREIVSVPSHEQYAIPAKPLDHIAPTPGSAQHLADTDLDIAGVTGKQQVATALLGHVTIPAENAAAALEVVSRFAVDPRWMIHLPPTMSPCATSGFEGYLEYPTEAFDYYRKQGVTKLICEEKHMGSRAIIVLARSQEAAEERFGIRGNNGTLFTRTGRPFFRESDLESDLLARLLEALNQSDFWDTYDTDWLCLDTEILPWSLKAENLIREQYAAAGSAGEAYISAALNAAQDSGHSAEFTECLTTQSADIASYRDAYRRYCDPDNNAESIRIAPFHLLATEGHVHTDKDHRWHMAFAEKLAIASDGLIQPTKTIEVDPNDPESVSSASAWWESLTSNGGEGMVVKPLSFLARGSKGLVQPAVKCRGREYLRIIYGPEYTRPENLSRLRKRNLNRKRSLALREFSLGIQALEHFVNRAPLRETHRCASAVLALESEPVDPRL